jgi:hypothetical protein
MKKRASAKGCITHVFDLLQKPEATGGFQYKLYIVHPTLNAASVIQTVKPTGSGLHQSIDFFLNSKYKRDFVEVYINDLYNRDPKLNFLLCKPNIILIVITLR